jgi:hypothetical protein
MAQTQRIHDSLRGVVVGLTMAMGFIVALGLPNATAPNTHSQDLAALEARTRTLPALSAFYQPLPDDNYKREALLVERVIMHVLNVHVLYDKFGPDMAGVSGYTDMSPRAPLSIHIDSALRWTARLEVLAHEAGHRLAPPALQGPSSESEVFAQAISFLVCKDLGHDTLESSASYLSVHKGGLGILTNDQKEIEYAVTVLVSGLK